MSNKTTNTPKWEPIRSETRLLPVDLTLEETAKKGHELAEVMEGIEEAKEAKRADVVLHNRRIKALEQQSAELSAAIVKSTEDRDIMCNIEGDFEGNCVRTVRTDNDEVIDERAMEEHERQGSMLDAERPPGQVGGDDDLPEEAGAQAGQGKAPKNL